LVVTLTEHCRRGSFCWRDTGVSACAQKSLGWLLLIHGKQTCHFLVDSFTVFIREALSMLSKKVPCFVIGGSSLARTKGKTITTFEREKVKKSAN
jgi:hypothetical protein